ncbi:MAG: DUF1670 domain-containing protein [Nitrospirae bacterium]|nr:MAG: DUF1670 domain-containing protein [Nitrospirota bacterium]
MGNKRQDSTSGKIEYVCLNEQFRKDIPPLSLNLTLIEKDDEELLAVKGLRELRHKRIMRLTAEAAEQGCLLSYDDLSALLLTSLATLKRDVAHIEEEGRVVVLKGRRKNGKPKEPVAEAFCFAEGVEA